MFKKLLFRMRYWGCLICLVFGFSFGCYKSATIPVYATGLETLYWTYWDLIYSISLSQGFEQSISNDLTERADWYDTTHGEGAWDEMIEQCQAMGDSLDNDISQAIDELKALPSSIKGKAVELSQSAWDTMYNYYNHRAPSDWYRNTKNWSSFLNSYSQAISTSQYQYSYPMLVVYQTDTTQYFQILVNSVKYPDSSCTYSFNDFVYASSGRVEYARWRTYGGNSYYTTGYFTCGLTFQYNFDGFSSSYGCTYDNYYIDSYQNIHTLPANKKIITGKSAVRSYLGATSNVSTYDDYITYTVDSACPKEVPESIPLKKCPAIPDEWRVLPGGGNDNEENPNVLPAVIPIEFPSSDPDEESTEESTEDPDEESTEDPVPSPTPGPGTDPDTDPDPDPDPDPNPDPDPDPNPDPDPDPDPEPDTEPIPDPEDIQIVDDSIMGDFTILKTKFPFCIPFDFVAAIKKIFDGSDTGPPVWEFVIEMPFIDYTFRVVIDWADYEEYVNIFREGFFILFVFGLMFATRKLISWQND